VSRLPSTRRIPLIVLVSILVACTLTVAGAQGLSPFAGQDLSPIRSLTGAPQAPSPFNPLGMPGSAYGSPHDSDTIPLSNGMFPGLFSGIPHLTAGFAYNFGNRVRQGRGILDYFLPIDLFPATTVFGEFHAEFQDFWQKPSDQVILAPSVGVGGLIAVPVSSQQRYDLAVGGGLRRGVAADTILGVNAFFDTSRVRNRWFSSGGFGLELLSLLPGDGLLDVNFNYYGNLFSGTNFINAFRYGTGNFDIEAGYSQPLFNQAIDLRLKAVGYQFDVGQKVYGWRVGADATTRDGVFRLTYEYTHDRIAASYHTIAGFVQLGFQLENLLRGESPFTMPEPVFGSPRSLSRIFHENVKRRWFQPIQIVQRREIPPTPPPPSPPPPAPTIVFLGVTVLSSTPGISVQNVDVGAATFDVLKVGQSNEQIILSYQFRMSDGSTQQVSATVATVSNPAGIVGINYWIPGFVTSVGPATMDNPAGSSTSATFGNSHRIDVLATPGSPHTATITITITVPSRPDIAPLVITCTASDQ
jgi:hypothetical protein